MEAILAPNDSDLGCPYRSQDKAACSPLSPLGNIAKVKPALAVLGTASEGIPPQTVLDHCSPVNRTAFRISYGSRNHHAPLEPEDCGPFEQV